MDECDLARIDIELQKNQEYLDSVIKSQDATRRRENRWWYALIMILTVLIALGSVFSILQRGLTAESALALIVGIPAIYLWTKSDKEKAERDSLIGRLYQKDKQLSDERRKVLRAIAEKRKEEIRSSMLFVNWDGRPAVSISPSLAYAIVKPNGDWEAVDAADVFSTGNIIPTEEMLKRRFERIYGPFDVDTLVSRLVHEDIEKTSPIHDGKS